MPTSMQNKPHERFERVYLEISNICNLQCSFCPVVERDNKICSPSDFAEFAKQVAPRTKQVCLHLMGEPLAHPQFVEIAKICEDLDLQIQLTTNGTMLKKHHDFLLKWKALRQINFSIHSYFANPTRQTLEQYLSPILEFSKALLELRPEVYINYRLWNQQNHTVIQSQNHSALDTIEQFYGIEMNRAIDVQSIKSKRLLGRLYLHFDTEFEWPNLNSPVRSTQGFCHALSKQVAIHADGTVVPCCLDKEAKIPLGNLHDTSLDQILASPRARAMAEGFKNGRLVEELCQKCSYISRFEA